MLHSDRYVKHLAFFVNFIPGELRKEIFRRQYQMHTMINESSRYRKEVFLHLISSEITYSTGKKDICFLYKKNEKKVNLKSF